MNYATRYLSDTLKHKALSIMQGSNQKSKEDLIEYFLKMSEIEKEIISLINN